MDKKKWNVHVQKKIKRDKNMTTVDMSAATDKFTCYICNECGSICVHVPINNYFECRACNNYSKFEYL